MKILLSFSRKHYNPETDKVTIPSIIGRMGRILYHLLQEFGEVDYIDCTKWVKGRSYDLLYSLPRNIWYLTRNNKFKKVICHLNIMESKFLKKMLCQDLAKIGCRLTGCYTPLNIYCADRYIHYGSEFSKQVYVKRGVPAEKIVMVYRGADDVPFKFRGKNENIAKSFS